MKSLLQLHLLPVADPGFSTVEKSGENRSSMDLDLGRQVLGLVLPQSLLERSNLGAASFVDVVVYIFDRGCVV